MARTVRRFSYPVTRWRYSDAAPTVTPQGHQITAWPTSATIVAHIHPAPGKVIEQLPEGHTGKRAVVMYTADDVRIASEEERTRGDLVQHNGSTFEVIKRGDWTAGAAGTSSYRDYVAVEVFDRLEPAP